MRIIVYLPFLASLLLALAGPRMAARMAPKAGTRLLLGAGLACAVTSLLSLSMLAGTLIARLPLVAAVGAWSGDRLHHDNPVPALTGKLAVIALTVFACTSVWTAARYVRSRFRLRRAVRLLGPGRLVVVDQPGLEAFAIPTGGAGRGRIVVSTGMLRTLSADERRVLLAHEAAHLDHRHHRHRALAALITAANPVLATLPAAIHHLTERWADEDAAATNDRRLTARALARAALATHRRSSIDGAVLCFGHTGVGHRVRALLTGTPPRRPIIAALLAGLLLASLLSATEAGRDSAQLLDQARDHYRGPRIKITNATRHEFRHLLSVLHHRI